MWDVGGSVSYNTERNRRALLGACRAPGAGCNITSHSAAKIKHVRTLLTAAASGTATTFFPALLLLLLPSFFPSLFPSFFSLFFPSYSLPLIRVKRVSPPELDPLSCASDNTALCFCALLQSGIFHGFFLFLLHFFFWIRGGCENNVIINATWALYQWDLRARWCVW